MEIVEMIRLRAESEVDHHAISSGRRGCCRDDQSCTQRSQTADHRRTFNPACLWLLINHRILTTTSHNAVRILQPRPTIHHAAVLRIQGIRPTTRHLEQPLKPMPRWYSFSRWRTPKNHRTPQKSRLRPFFEHAVLRQTPPVADVVQTKQTNPDVF